MTLQRLTAQMQQAGIRRLAVISGDPAWCLMRATSWRDALAGDWLTLSDNAPFPGPHSVPGAVRTLLVHQVNHALSTARPGLHTETLSDTARPIS
ncbi:MAG TPA: tRNA cytosine(34) acetyltransferase TmcA, partial [Pantoea sp.]|nr:tRNA cytosine(34) acetyltransferase TmcA [Pantoea sp.]